MKANFVSQITAEVLELEKRLSQRPAPRTSRESSDESFDAEFFRKESLSDLGVDGYSDDGSTATEESVTAAPPARVPVTAAPRASAGDSSDRIASSTPPRRSGESSHKRPEDAGFLRTWGSGIHSHRDARVLDSSIISDFPAIFANFRSSEFRLLWRTNGDLFTVADFHHHCNDRPNTLTVIRDTRGYIFGGFTPVPWESRVWNRKREEANNCRARDASGKSFLFTIKNPWGHPPKKFPVRKHRKDCAVYLCEKQGPSFGCYPHDLSFGTTADGGRICHTMGFGYSYDPGGLPDSTRFLTGDRTFTLREIEVFQIVDERPRPG
jgi:hypothetical protein